MRISKKYITILSIIVLCLFNATNIVLASNSTYSCKITNKITGEYNDKSQKCSYFVCSTKGDITSVSGASNSEKITTYLICYTCNQIFISNDTWQTHSNKYSHARYTAYQGYIGYIFDLGNNETATIKMSSSTPTITICRIYDSTQKIDNQIANYSINSSSSTIKVCDINSSEGMSDFTTTFSSSGGDTIVVTNSDNVSVPTGVNTSTIITALLLLLSIVLFVITKLIKKIKVTIV
jgi:hypothetical protein